MSKLNEQDQAKLNRISELLAELKPLMYGVSHLIDQDCYNPYAPIAPVAETEYVEFVNSEIPKYPKGSIWLWSYLQKAGFRDMMGTFYAYDYNLKPSTLAAFTAQNTIAQTEWKVGEWAWLTTSKLYIGLITEIADGKATSDNQNGFLVKELHINEFVKPTEEEVATHLTKIAEQRGFRAGVRIKSDYPPYNGEEWTIPDGERFIYDKGEKWLLLNNYEIWRSGKWASILEVEPIKEESKYSVFTGSNEGNYEVLVLGMKTLAEANQIANKIKQILK
jgi:hypothetical protein